MFGSLLSLRADCKTTVTWKKVQPGLAGCLLLCYNLVPPIPTQNGPSEPICRANRLFSTYLGHFWPTLGHILDILGLAYGPNWSALMSSVLFQPCYNQLYKKYGIKAYFVIFGPTLASFWQLLESKSQFLHHLHMK